LVTFGRGIGFDDVKLRRRASNQPARWSLAVSERHIPLIDWFAALDLRKRHNMYPFHPEV
jgi:hypothetical protein